MLMVDTEPKIKVTRTYSLDPVIIAWVTQKALRLSLESDGQDRISDSKVVNDILRAAMEKENEIEDVSRAAKLTKERLVKKVGTR